VYAVEFWKPLLSHYIETSGIFAPLLFIILHMIRPILFIPVILYCILGGLFFGIVAGSIYSIIGLTLSSIIVYFFLHRTPKTFHHILSIKDKVLGRDTNFSKSQITWLRLIPFIHFNLLAICLIELSVDLKDYMKSTFYTSIPFTIIYTTLGQWIINLHPFILLILFVIVCISIYTLRKKEMTIKWSDFFYANA